MFYILYVSETILYRHLYSYPVLTWLQNLLAYRTIVHYYHAATEGV